MARDIFKELKETFEELKIPAGLGYYIGTGDEPIFIVYLPYNEDPTAVAENQVAEMTHLLKIDIIARNGNSFIETEEIIRNKLKSMGYIFSNAELSVDTSEPYNYHRVLHYSIKEHFEDI